MSPRTSALDYAVDILCHHMLPTACTACDNRKLAAEELNALRTAKSRSFFEGLREGIRRYAWWKEGVQQVGSCGTTLAKALAEVDVEERKS